MLPKAYRGIQTLTKREAVRLRQLNSQLQHTEAWLRERLKKGFLLGRGVCSQPGNEAGLSLQVVCLRHPLHPRFDPSAENIVAILDAGFLAMPAEAASLQARWQAFNEWQTHFLGDMPASTLFMMFVLEASQGDMTPLLEAGQVRATIALHQEKLLPLDIYGFL